MPRRYFLYSTNSDLTNGSATYNKYLLPNLIGGPSASIQNISLTANANLTASCFTYQLHPGDHAQTGSYTASLQVSTGNANINLSARFHRINSAGTIQSSSVTTPEQAITTATTYTFLSSSVDLGTFANTDRIRVDYLFRNARNNTQTAAFQYNQTGSFTVIAAYGRKVSFS